MADTEHLEQWVEQFLEHSQIRGPSNVFVLGCFERRRVTVGAQQVRAVNLVEALLRREILADSLLVVGAGAGGLTAAAYAAYQGVAKIHVIDREPKPLTTFAGSNRLLHPRLYEWPFDKDWRKEEVDLPLMNWSAGEAHVVAEQLRQFWESWCELYEIQFHPNCGLQGFDGGKPMFDRATDEALPDVFDATILSVGFGKEQPGPDGIDSPGYWARDDLDEAAGSILVCGNGDGALTDLFRSRVRDFKQELLQEFVETVSDSEPFRARALEIERAYESEMRAASKDLGAQFEAIRRRALACESLVTEDMVKFVGDRLRTDTKTTLFVRQPQAVRSEEQWLEDEHIQRLFTLAPHCFPLNRLFANALFGADKQFARDKGGRRLKPEFGTREQELPKSGATSYDRVFFRAGTDAAIKSIVSQEEQTRLRHIVQDPDPAKGDMTRFPLWGPKYLDASPLALIPWTESKKIVAEVYRQVGKLITYTDLLDSVTQAKLYDATKPESAITATDHFRGVLRLLALLYDEILLVDVQLFDGQFFVKWRQEFQDRRLEQELRLYQDKLLISTRPGGLGAFRGFYLNPDRTVKEFEPSAFPKREREMFLEWQREEAKGHSFNSLEEYFAAFVSAQPGAKAVIEELTAIWRLVEKESSFKVRGWGSRNLNTQFEDPGRFFTELSPEGREIVKRFWPDRQIRTIVWNILNSSRTPESADEVDKIQAWYNRAYNRANAKQNDCTVFTTLHGGWTPVDAESADRLSMRIDLSGLGRIPSEEYLRFHADLSEELLRHRESGDLRYKLDVLHKLSECGEGGVPETFENLTDKWTRRILDSLRLEEFEQLWIGSRESSGKEFSVIERELSPTGEKNSVTEISPGGK